MGQYAEFHWFTHLIMSIVIFVLLIFMALISSNYNLKLETLKSNAIEAGVAQHNPITGEFEFIPKAEKND